MIDLHCHILPGIDDGAKNLEDSINMAKVAVDSGITHILCTPHHNNGTYRNPKYDVIQQVAALQKELDSREIALTLFEGQEVRITGELLEDIEQDNILFADIDDQYLLIEFPSNDVPAFTEKIFFELLSREITPVIVHPERNSVFIDEPNKIIPFLEMGVLSQMTAPSYVGTFGKKIQKTAKIMLEHNLVHMVASDAHNVDKRSFYMKEAYELMGKEFGSDKVESFQLVTKDIINGDSAIVPNFVEVKKSRFNLFR
ncbi:tyrosine protein phosphatase [Vagococcus sp. BWB3-3]|uniref:Tyrosine-protein phosphatase n=1 Tax=Vagococcus allomyrinae TaxID=2794353 RepID=A0A940P8H5_9ENTE|nr:CpsB/CapC family capsule biosynthesis tyrosine phosphatase [Vagococcus allomyrinae]MBP1043654.1 tyrosine protein phosphatase [Vagococcus allomyrinae]